MSRTVLGGAVLAVAGALTVALGGVLGLELDSVALLGVALGAVVGLVPDRAPVARVVGFLLGIAVAFVFFALRAAVLPDSSSGRAVAVFLGLLACMGLAAASLGRVPLWSILLGAAALVGSYEDTYAAAPSQLVREAPAAMTTVLLAAAIGHLATTLLGPEIERGRAAEHASTRRPSPPARPPSDLSITGSREAAR